MDEENELLAQRRQKLEALQARGVAAFGAAFATSGTVGEVCALFTEGAVLAVAGPITAHRDMGKSHFVDLRDSTGRIQIYVQTKELGPEIMGTFGLLDMVDFIVAQGACF